MATDPVVLDLPPDAQKWCHVWFAKDGLPRYEPDRVAALLKAFVAAGLHLVTEPTFTWGLRAGYCNDWSIRLAWDDRSERVDLTLRYDKDTNLILWRIKHDNFVTHDIQSTLPLPTLEAAETKIGFRIKDKFLPVVSK
jgi:hypothetical protein